LSKKIFVGLIFIFIFLSFVAFQGAMPESKNKRIQSILKPYLPYTLEKRLGGLTIVNKKTGVKEKPENAVVYKRLDELEKNWGKKHLVLKQNTLNIINDKNITVKTIKINNKKEMKFINKFFNLAQTN
jgi:hypothetical protein